MKKFKQRKLNYLQLSFRTILSKIYEEDFKKKKKSDIFSVSFFVEHVTISILLANMHTKTNYERRRYS